MGDKVEIKDGDVFEHDYPFLRYAHEDTIFSFDDYKDSVRFIPRWKPATEYRYTDPTGGTKLFADGMGRRRLTVYGVFKPSKFPSRVFYTQEWKDPESDKFYGLSKCRIKTLGCFRRMAMGFQLRNYDNELIIQDVGKEAILQAARQALQSKGDSET